MTPHLILLALILHQNVIVYSASIAVCTTLSPDNPEPCVFPFRYDGVDYNECTSVDAETPVNVWCATEVAKEFNNTVIDGRWGDCSESCPGAIQDPPPKCTKPGETVPAGDGCNTCICMEDGTLGTCTIEACVENPIIIVSESNTKQDSDECIGKTCGEACSIGICDGDGTCVNPIETPCVVHGCDELKCGDECFSADIVGVCNVAGECISDLHSVTISGECGAQSRDSEVTTTFESPQLSHIIEKSDLELNTPLEKSKSSLGIPSRDSEVTTPRESPKLSHEIQKSGLEVSTPLEKPKSSLGIQKSDSETTTSLEKPKSPLLNCIHVNDLCLKIRREGIDGPSCSKIYIQCVKDATSTNGNRLPTSILN